MNVIERMVDELGRVVIPADFRSALHIGTKCVVAMQVNDGSIIITPKQMICAICGNPITAHRKHHLCDACVEEIKKG